MPKVRSGAPRRPASAKSAVAKQAKTEVKPQKAADKFSAPKKSTEKLFPRPAWNDAAALEKALDDARGKTAGGKRTHPKLAHVHKRHKPQPKPVIVARYGLPVKPGGGGVKPGPGPVIVARYGLPVKPGGGGVKPSPGPVIVARYGLPVKPGGGGKPTPPKPVIVARYGLPVKPGGGGVKPSPGPVIVARYGLPTRPK